MNALIKYNGGHEETSPNGEWVLHLRDGIDVATNTYLHLSLYNTLEQSTPVVDFITRVPGFEARGPDTKAIWSEDGHGCLVQLYSFHEANIKMDLRTRAFTFHPTSKDRPVSSACSPPLLATYSLVLGIMIYMIIRGYKRGQHAPPAGRGEAPRP